MKSPAGFKLYGLFGHPLGHTLSPAMHEAAFARAGIAAHYIVLDLLPKDFKKTLRSISRSPLSGFNVTVPYKEAVMPHLTAVRPAARAIGAVNTVFRQGKRWIGTNTDMEGFLITLVRDAKFRLRGKKAVVLGAGGAARAVVYGLGREGIGSILVADCVPRKAARIVGDMRKLFRKTAFAQSPAGSAEVRTAVLNADLVINATPLGLKPSDPRVIPADWVPPARAGKKCFMDLVYNPPQTPFLRDAAKKGHRTLNGLGMLLYQGARAWELWTGKKAPVEVMRESLQAALSKS
ncbi:MAG: shikimate dehydrogenase [Candidatus Omnitrophota bacterium]